MFLVNAGCFKDVLLQIFLGAKLCPGLIKKLYLLRSEKFL